MNRVRDEPPNKALHLTVGAPFGARRAARR